MPSENLLHGETADQIIRAFYHVHNSLGFGFLERVYEKALMRTLQKCGLWVQRQLPIEVWFEGEIVGRYFADLAVSQSVIVEVKAEESLCPRNEAQLVNYLKATHFEVGLLLNFGEKPVFRRNLLINDRKPHLRSSIATNNRPPSDP